MIKEYKVKLVSGQFSEHSGIGIIEYGVRLAKALKKRKTNIKFYFVSLTRSNIYRIPRRAYSRVMHSNEHITPDLVHYITPGFMLRDLIRGAWLRKRLKLVVTVHDFYFARFTFKMMKNVARYVFKRPFFVIAFILTSPFSIIVDRLTTLFVAKEADSIICVSEETKEVLIKKYHVDPRKCVVVYPIINQEFRQIAVKRKNKKIIIGHLSSYLPNKNVEVLIRAFKKTHSQKLELHLYGSGLPFKISDDKRIKYHGFVPTERIPKILNSFDVFVFPSTWEGFGMPIMEAKRCKVPVITYAKGQLPTIAKRNTLQFEDEKSLRNMLETSAWEKVNVNAAYKDASACDENYVSRKILDIYDKLLK